MHCPPNNAFWIPCSHHAKAVGYEMPLIPAANSKLSSAQPESPKDFSGSLLHEAAGLSTTGSRIHCRKRMAVFNESRINDFQDIV